MSSMFKKFAAWAAKLLSGTDPTVEWAYVAGTVVVFSYLGTVWWDMWRSTGYHPDPQALGLGLAAVVGAAGYTGKRKGGGDASTGA